MRASPRRDDFFCRHQRCFRSARQHDADAPRQVFRAEGRDAFAANKQFAAQGGLQTGQCAEQRTLAATVGPNERSQRGAFQAACQLQPYNFLPTFVPVADRQILEGNGRIGRKGGGGRCRDKLFHRCEVTHFYLFLVPFRSISCLLASRRIGLLCLSVPSATGQVGVMIALIGRPKKYAAFSAPSRLLRR